MKQTQVLEKSVLVADNDVVILESIAGRFRQLGFKVITANSGDEAYDLYMKFNPNVVIIDEDLKEIDGLQLFLKLFFFNPSIKVILTTRKTESIEGASDSENFVVLKKRFSDDDLDVILKDVKFTSKTFGGKDNAINA